jgi:hypothetical protein
LRPARRSFGAIVAIVAAAVASSVLTFIGLAVSGQLSAPSSSNWPLDIAVLLAIILIWGPAVAVIPAGILGFAVERPVARRLVARASGGFIGHLLIVLAAATFLWLLLRTGSRLSGSTAPFLDLLSLAFFLAIGLCSAMSWWFLVVLPGRRA